jgi:hypothetical protein
VVGAGLSAVGARGIRVRFVSHHVGILAEDRVTVRAVPPIKLVAARPEGGRDEAAVL